MDVKRFLNETQDLGLEDFLQWSVRVFGSGLTFASSLGPEDQVLHWHLDQALNDLRLSAQTFTAFTLDTGRLPSSTYELMDQTRKSFRLPLKILFPESASVEAMVAEHGAQLFYESVELRKKCCGVRKVAPLSRALAGKKAWITGLRREQSVTRQNLERIEWDEAHGLIKINPLLEWSRDEVWEVIHSQNLPYNGLHDRGYLSIGCDPCTRAVAPGESERSGRWWWESPEHKECGLHVQEGSAAVKPLPFLQQIKKI